MICRNKHNHANTQVNKAKASKTWWENIKKLEANHNPSPEKFLINDECLSPEQFIENLNNYYATVGGEFVPDCVTIPDVDINYKFSLAAR